MKLMKTIKRSHSRIAEAQLAVADPKKHPELAGTVKTIDTRPFWREPDVSPMNQDYHYNHNAETHMLVGDALGRAMVEMEGGKVEYPAGEMDPSISAVPFMPPPSADDLAKMSMALRPVVLDKLIPDYAAEAPGIPRHHPARKHGELVCGGFRSRQGRVENRQGSLRPKRWQAGSTPRPLRQSPVRMRHHT